MGYYDEDYGYNEEEYYKKCIKYIKIPTLVGFT